MLISVIIPCYNIERYVERCVRSVLAQDCSQELEILLVDDGSTDGTPDVCDRLAGDDPRIRAFHQKNGGPGTARNTGIDNARGELLAFADGDDAMYPQMLSSLAGALISTGADIAVCPFRTVPVETAQGAGEPGLGMTGSSAEESTSEGAEDIRLLSREEALHFLVVEDEEENAPVIQNAAWNKVYRRQVFEGIRYPAGRYEDILTMARILASVKSVCYVDRRLYAYTGNRGTSIMNGSELESILTEQIPAYRARNAFFEEIGHRELIPMGDYLIGKKLLILYTQGHSRRETRKAADALGRAIREWFRPRFDEIYHCSIADKHHALRMRLFLIHPVLYRAFTALNEGIVLPLRIKLRGRRTTEEAA